MPNPPSKLAAFLTEACVRNIDENTDLHKLSATDAERAEKCRFRITQAARAKDQVDRGLLCEALKIMADNHIVAKDCIGGDDQAEAFRSSWRMKHERYMQELDADC